LKSSILLVGPDPEFITGQSVAFKYLLDSEFGKQDNVHYCFNSAGTSTLAKLLGFVIYFFKLIYLFIRLRPKTIYLTNSRSKFGLLRDTCIFFLANLFGSKVVVHLHGSDFKTFIDTLARNWRILANWGYGKVVAAIVLSEPMRAQFSMYKHIDVEVVENCFSEKISNFSNNRISTPLKILFLSNLMQTKGIIELAEAVKKVNVDKHLIDLKIAGAYLTDGALNKHQMQDKIEALLSNNIEYCGVVKGEQKNKLLEWSNVVALPSYYPTEAQPIVLIEGLAAGRYLLTSKAGYISEFVKHLENGFVLNTVSVHEITKALNYMLVNQREIEKVSQQNIGYAHAHFSQEQYVNRIFEIIGVSL
jgi:glycosyltransferase involved in cell wall biosynthesis